MKTKRNILIAVTGITPQVVTETLYSLMAQKNIRIHEIYIVTTADGKEKILSEPTLHSEIKRMCIQYNLQEPAFDPATHIITAKEETVELYDIRSDRENQLMPNIICDFVRKKSQNSNVVLHCSLAGGRKTMSVAMAFALSLFGRRNDKLYHVLVSKEFEQSKKYFPEHKDEEKQIILSEIPYIRLREKLPLLKEHPTATFSELVELAQEGIDELETLPHIVFDKETYSVTVGEKKIKFQPFDFAFYLFIAKQKRPVLGGKQFSDENWEKLKNLYWQISPTKHRERVSKTIDEKGEQRLTKSACNIRRIMERELGKQKAQLYAVQCNGEYGKICYEIPLDKSKIKIK